MFSKKEWLRENKRYNQTRQSVGLWKLELKKRRCLRCDREFVSESANNRMCINCKQVTRNK